MFARTIAVSASDCRARVDSQKKTFTSADDVAQEVCLAVFAALPNYRDQGRPFLAFVYGIAAHKVADAHRSSARNRAEPVPEIPDTTDELADGPQAQVMQGELAGRMRELSDKQREILVRAEGHARTSFTLCLLPEMDSNHQPCD